MTKYSWNRLQPTEHFWGRDYLFNAPCIHAWLSAPCSTAGNNKPRPRSGGVNFNNLISIQPACAIQAVCSDLFHFDLSARRLCF